ncbi:DUF2778 domain-containing protein [Kalamiella sp. sgz302252]|uniref:DUF2778 domain-containing protein n=1 Tax=Pantoea sp. sgz302252 TaxID=3341827 RepID=UPI0036D379F7
MNNADYAPLHIDGVGTFQAYSGNGRYRNKTGFTHIAINGPLPTGRYYIVDRPTRGAKGTLYNIAHDSWSWPTSTPVIKGEWFALYSDDCRLDDKTFINEVERGSFRLHPPGPAGISLGCITLRHRSDFLFIRQALLATTCGKLTNGLKCYGEIDKSCRRQEVNL